MSNTAQLLIPPKLRVGFQNREGTYTGKLAYVIYFDGKGELRKAKSWESWRDKNIDARDFDNVPTEGFVLRPTGSPRTSYQHAWSFETEPGVFADARTEYTRHTPDGVAQSTKFWHTMTTTNGKLIVSRADAGVWAYHNQIIEVAPVSPHPWREPTNDRLFAVLECGAEVEVGPYSLSRG